MIGHYFSSTPYPVQSENPTTVSEYIAAEMPFVLRDLMIFQAWGVKLRVEATAAKLQIIVAVFITVISALHKRKGRARLPPRGPSVDKTL